MQNTRKASFAAATLLALAFPLLTGCSSSRSSATTTTRASVPAGSTPTTSGVPSLPATGSVDGFTMAVTSSPTTGEIGHAVIHATAVLTGNVKPGTLDFQVSDQPSAESGKPATSQKVPIHRGRHLHDAGGLPPEGRGVLGRHGDVHPDSDHRIQAQRLRSAAGGRRIGTLPTAGDDHHRRVGATPVARLNCEGQNTALLFEAFAP